MSDLSVYFEKAPVALLVLDTETMRVVSANEKAAGFLGYRKQTLSRAPLAELVPSIDLSRLTEVLLRSAETSEVPNSHLIQADGAIRDVDFSVSRMPESALAVLAVQDSSERGQLEEQLRQSQKTEALGMLTGEIAHDFNNLLTIISGYSQMLRMSSLASDSDRTALNEVLKACEHAAGLTAQLLAFSRRQPLKVEVIDVNRLLEQTAAMLRRLIGEQIELRIAPATDAGSIVADAGQIRQVILNLAINARDAMPQGGVLSIRTRRVESGGPRSGSSVMLEVADTGSGMDEATRRRIFEPFFTTRLPGKGTGLGLSTVHRIVKQLSGTIDVSSEPGQGASFRVCLPRADEQALPEVVERVDVRGGHETVLIAEDDAGVASMTRAALERRGYQVLVAASGSEALAAEMNHAGPISLLITDIVMPGMNGIALATLLRARRPSMAVLYTSGYPGGQPGDPTMLEPDASFLQKPFTAAQLTSMVRSVLDHKTETNGSAKK